MKQGDRIKLLSMGDDPDPIMIGEEGNVISISGHGGGRGFWEQVDVCWDNGRTLMLVCPPDRIEVTKKGNEKCRRDKL